MSDHLTLNDVDEVVSSVVSSASVESVVMVAESRKRKANISESPPQSVHFYNDDMDSVQLSSWSTGMSFLSPIHTEKDLSKQETSDSEEQPEEVPVLGRPVALAVRRLSQADCAARRANMDALFARHRERIAFLRSDSSSSNSFHAPSDETVTDSEWEVPDYETKGAQDVISSAGDGLEKMFEGLTVNGTFSPLPPTLSETSISDMASAYDMLSTINECTEEITLESSESATTISDKNDDEPNNNLL